MLNVFGGKDAKLGNSGIGHTELRDGKYEL